MRQETEPTNHEISIIAPHGLGYGEGLISVETQIKHGELTHEVLSRAIDIVQQSDTVFTKVDIDAPDDGCGDGRPTAKVFRVIKRPDERIVEEFNKSRRRAKVFGGGLVVASSMLRVLKGQPLKADTVLRDRAETTAILNNEGIPFGAHTDTHATDDQCGCGAIDKYPAITRNVITFRDGISSTLVALYGSEYSANEHAINEVFDYYEGLLTEHPEYFTDAEGSKTMGIIEDNGAYIKQLSDTHLEDLIVINDIEGTTFDQRAFDAELREIVGDDAPQVQAFTFDTWRGRMYADAMSKHAVENNPSLDLEFTRKKAYADFLIRSTLAVAATLTAGDLPVIGRTAVGKPHYALAA